MFTTDIISGIRARAARDAALVLEHAGRDEIDPSLLDRVRACAAALEVAAAAPVRAGLGGGFKTGKSVLMGYLLGDAGLLPVADQAATGAIIEVHPVVGQVAATLPSPTATVRYFDRATVEQYRDELVKTLRAEAAPFGLSGPDGDSWPQLSAWCQTVLWPRPELRPRVLELIDLRDAVCGLPQLADGPSIEVPWQLARKHLLMIGESSGPRTGPPGWTPPPPVPAPRFLEPATLAAGRRLVERVRITVTVPQRCWPLEGRSTEQLVLCDTPGRGASPARVRDELLLRRLMSELDAFVVVMDPAHPDAAVVGELQREFAAASGHARAITVVNKFDQYPASAPELEAGLGVISEAAIRQVPSLSGLAAAWATATGVDEQAGHDVVFASAVTAWALEGADTPPPVPVPADSSLAQWRQAKARRARVWGALGDRAERRGIAGPLADYGDDGGMGRLRELLTGHVARVGLTRKLERMRQLRAELDEALLPAKVALRLWYESRRDDAEADRDALRAEVIRPARLELLATLERCDVDVFRRDFRLDNGLTAQEEVTRRALRHIGAWPVWTRLWDTVKDRQVWPNPRSHPMVGDELRGDFALARAAAEQDGRAVADLVVDLWLTRRRQEIGDRVKQFKAAIDPVRDRFGSEFDVHRRQLARAVQVQWLKAQLVEAGDPADSADAASRHPRDPFPLRREYRLAWHPESGALPADLHQVNIARLQHALSAAVVRAGLDAWAARLRVLTAELRDALEQLDREWCPPAEWTRFVLAAHPPVLRDAMPDEAPADFGDFEKDEEII
ncbi:hypothetical protein ACFO3J_18365 [Streptomyces polygonati]|uniref:Dynamin family protein n=1 Tax=Streptomyces polygonati TaxID=1617087 RepID=A0ABV8HRD6_9ACTN